MAVLARDDLRLIEVTGDDRVGYLDDVTSQRLADAAPGEVRGAMVLDAHGAPQAVFWVAVHAERLALLAPPAAADHVLEVLARRTFLADVTFTAQETPVWSLRGDDVAATLGAIGVHDLPPGRWRPVADGLLVHHAFGAELVGDELAERVRQTGRVDDEPFDEVRVRVGEPILGREIAAPHLPEEVGLLATHVHLAKGCYPGQEAVARMWMLGRPRRRLARVRIDGDVTSGWTVGSGKRKVEVTAVADGRGLAFVPSAAEVGDRFDADDADGAVEVLAFVGEDRDPPGWDRSVPRRRDRR